MEKIEFDYSKYDFKNSTAKYKILFNEGLSEDIVRKISKLKDEPEWMTDFRTNAYKFFVKRPVPEWGADLSKINFENITYFARATDKKTNNWADLPDDIRDTYDKLGIPEAEKKSLSGVEVMYESEVVYNSIKKELEELGVIFCDTDTAIKQYPELVKKYFGKVISPNDNKFAALNSAVWSGGSFIYVPKGVKVPMPLQAYFRINAANMGQFERTLIIADEGSDVTYIEGCLPAEELVSNGETFSTIESISKGNGVISHKGKKRKVEQTFQHKHVGDMFTIIPQSKGNSFRITGEHPVLCIRRESVMTKRKKRYNWEREVSTKNLMKAEPKFIPVKEIKKGDFLVYTAPIFTKNSNELNDDKLRLLGLYLAEGSVSFNKAIKRDVLQFSFGKTEKERELASEVLKIIKKNGEKGSITKTRGGYYTVASYSKTFINLCLKHCGHGASTKILSKEIMELPAKKQMILLRYYWKGDGNIYIRKKSNSKMLRAATVSRILVYQLQEILARNGIFSNISIRKASKDIINGRKIKRKEQYILEFTEDKHLGEVRRKDNYFFVPIKKIIKNSFYGMVYNFAVEKDNSYLVKGFAVHNCTAPVYSKDSLHAAVVEVIAHKNAHVKYITVQNWSSDVYNLVTKRAFAYENSFVEWIDANMGSKVTEKYPSVYLMEPGAKSNVLSVALANKGQHQDTGTKAVHLAPNTSSVIQSKSICLNGGRTTYRGLVKVKKGATDVKSSTRCDALIFDDFSRTDTYPYMEIDEEESTISHEASVGKIGDEQLFYLESRGLSELEAINMIVLGFIAEFVEELPIEFAVEFNRLIKINMEGAVG
jgi:Fe-S cluster assembly protein SufB